MKNKNQNGYAILFTVILVSIISLISFGLSNTIYKQLLISSGARDSQISFFQSDMATECALYADIFKGGEDLKDGGSFNCGFDKDGNAYTMNVSLITYGDVNTYTLNPGGVSTTNPCFKIEIRKTPNLIFTGAQDTKISASGYNTCNQYGSRTVERTIEVNY